MKNYNVGVFLIYLFYCQSQTKDSNHPLCNNSIPQGDRFCGSKNFQTIVQ
ncbi:hypothetical protein [Okeania sp. SIO2B3]|nr:hypothetical protein [Okeania sp. SIO2B3]NET43521.1 hypothetical protein [Okeania sp. SIO2B3]